MVMNGKFAGAGMVMAPYATVNDGLADISWMSDPQLNNLFGIASLMSDAKKRGGAQVYKN